MFNPRIKVIKVGDIIRHTIFGEGLITKRESAPGDIKVTITFNNNNEIKQFLLSHTPMEKIGEYKAPPEKTKEHTSPRTYTPEFKIKIVKQALSEGRAIVRKQYTLPEATLRRGIKELS